MSDTFANCFEDELYLVVDCAIFEPDEGNAVALQVSCTAPLMFLYIRRKVRRPVQLHRQPALRTIKIDNVATYADLSSKLLAEKFSVLQAGPEDSFGRSRGFPELFAKRFL